MRIDINPGFHPGVPIRIPDGPGGERELLIAGRYADGTSVSLERSTQITIVSQNPEIARVEKLRRMSGGDEHYYVIAVREGSTKLLINGKFTADVVVSAAKRHF